MYVHAGGRAGQGRAGSTQVPCYVPVQPTPSMVVGSVEGALGPVRASERITVSCPVAMDWVGVMCCLMLCASGGRGNKAYHAAVSGLGMHGRGKWDHTICAAVIGDGQGDLVPLTDCREVLHPVTFVCQWQFCIVVVV